ncbi:MAG: DUF1552 domain-containing protein [Bryobacteraceae bacterium]
MTFHSLKPVTRKHLSRRTLLRGLGTVIALPALDAMTPAFAAPAKTTGAAPTRLMFAYVPNGIIMQDWTPEATGAAYDFKRIMKPLEPVRAKINVLTGLTHNTGRALGDGPGDHARAASTFLTGTHPKKTAGADISLDISADQMAARAVGKHTRFASLELGLEMGRLAGNCDSGYSCAYSNSISWRGPNTPNPPEVNPRNVFERLFGDLDPTESEAARARRKLYDRGVLDFVLEDARSLQTSLGATDRRKLDEYLTAIREIETRIAANEKMAASQVDLSTLAPDFEKPAGIPVDFQEHSRVMFDMMTIAMQADLTRVMTVMLAREGSNRPYREIGIPDGHHNLTHHKGNAEWIEKIRNINEYHVRAFAAFLSRLDAIQDGDGSLLDHSMIVYGSGISDGNKHTHHDLPVILAGGGGGKLRTGRHVRYPHYTPLTNLYVTLLEHMGVQAGGVGDSNGRLNHLDA